MQKENKNGNHFTAAALSQTGYEVAERFAKISKVTISSEPTKLTYYVWDKLDIKCLKLKVKFVSGATKNVTTGFTSTPTKLNTVGEQIIEVNYEGKTETFTV